MIVSIFGQIEEAAAEYMLTKHPDECRKITTDTFPPRALCPEIWTNKRGDAVKFAILVPKNLEQEYHNVVSGLYA
jgi:hypothetical protein